VSVHNGDTLHFVFNTASADGFHTVVFGKPGQTPAQIASTLPNLAADNDPGDAAGTQKFAAFFGSNPPPGSGAPGACGDATTPCVYNGMSDMSSGAMFAGGPFTQFYYKILLPTNPTAPVVVNYICNVHGPAMNGTFTIVPNASPASTQAALDAAASTQYNSDVAAGTTIKAAVGAAAVTTNADGSHTIGMTAGTETADGRVQVLEMLPNSVTVQPGDKVKWSVVSHNDPHTITFPRGSGSNAIDPIPQLCDVATGDTAATGPPPTFGCAGPPNSPTGLELGWTPQPQGALTTISSNTTAGSSGVLDAGTYYGNVPTSYTYAFPSTGTFLYQCRIHGGMIGQIIVKAAAVTTPATGTRANTTIPLYLVPPALLLIVGSLLVARRRRPG
jgi:plastocyanin